MRDTMQNVKKPELAQSSEKYVVWLLPHYSNPAFYLYDKPYPNPEVLSRNTRENALYSKQLVDRTAPGSRCLFITSAWYTRRVKACFHKAGLICEAFGTDFLTEKSNGNGWNWLEPDWKALMKWELLIKEWGGWLAYRIKGYI